MLAEVELVLEFWLLVVAFSEHLAALVDTWGATTVVDEWAWVRGVQWVRELLIDLNRRVIVVDDSHGLNWALTVLFLQWHRVSQHIYSRLLIKEAIIVLLKSETLTDRCSFIVEIERWLGYFHLLHAVVLGSSLLCLYWRVNLVVLIYNCHAFQVRLVTLVLVVADQYLLLNEISQIKLVCITLVRIIFSMRLRLAWDQLPCRLLLLLFVRQPSIDSMADSCIAISFDCWSCVLACVFLKLLFRSHYCLLRAVLWLIDVSKVPLFRLYCAILVRGVLSCLVNAIATLCSIKNGLAFSSIRLTVF